MFKFCVHFVEAFLVCMKYSPDEKFDPTLLTPYLNAKNRDFSKLTGVNRVHIPFIVCGDLSAFDSDTTYPLNDDGKKNYKYHDPVQPPKEPHYSFFNRKTTEDMAIEIKNLPICTFDFTKTWDELKKDFNFFRDRDELEKEYVPFNETEFRERILGKDYVNEMPETRQRSHPKREEKDLSLLDNYELFQYVTSVLEKHKKKETDGETATESETTDLESIEEAELNVDELSIHFSQISLGKYKTKDITETDYVAIREMAKKPDDNEIELHENAVKLHKLCVKAAKSNPNTDALEQYLKTINYTQGYFHLFGADKCKCCAPSNNGD